jgi:hypothetical protein
MAAAVNAIAYPGHGALEATDRTVDDRAADGARGSRRRISSPRYNTRRTSNDVHSALLP